MQALSLAVVLLLSAAVYGGHPAKPNKPTWALHTLPKSTCYELSTNDLLLRKKPHPTPSPYVEKLVDYGASNGTVLEGYLVYPRWRILTALETRQYYQWGLLNKFMPCLKIGKPTRKEVPSSDRVPRLHRPNRVRQPEGQGSCEG